MQCKYGRYKVDIVAQSLSYFPFLSLSDSFPERLVALFTKGLRQKGSKYQRDLAYGRLCGGMRSPSLLWSPWPRPSCLTSSVHQLGSLDWVSAGCQGSIHQGKTRVASTSLVAAQGVTQCQMSAQGLGNGNSSAAFGRCWSLSRGYSTCSGMLGY